MRYSILLASAFAAEAVAMPYLEARAIVPHFHTVTVIDTVVVFVTVTRGAGQSTASSSRLSATTTTSSSFVSQPAIIGAPMGTSMASSTSSLSVSIPSIDLSSYLSSLSQSAVIAPAATSSSSGIVSSSASSSSSVASGASASAAASPIGTSSSVAASTSIQAPTSASAVSSSASPSSTIVPAHLSGPQQAYLTSGDEYQNAILYHHNEARANHNAAPLVWNTTCADNALIAANMCNFAHYIPPGAGNGQNLFTVSGPVFNVTAGITESWYKAEFPPMLPYFGQASLPNDVFEQVGHLTQVVWQGTTSVGCVSVDCGDHMMVNGAVSTLNKFTVCNYAPQGNIAGQFDTGVLPPISTTNLGSYAD